MMSVIISSTATYEEVKTREDLAREIHQAADACERAARGLNRIWTRGRLKVYGRCADRFDAAVEEYEALQ